MPYGIWHMIYGLRSIYDHKKNEIFFMVAQNTQTVTHIIVSHQLFRMAMRDRSFVELPHLIMMYKLSVDTLGFPHDGKDTRWHDSRTCVVLIKQIDDDIQNKNSKCYLLINQLRNIIKQFTYDQQRVFWILCYDICCMMFYTTEYQSRNFTNENVRVFTNQQLAEWNITFNNSRPTYVYENLRDMPIELLQRYIAVMKYAEREFTILYDPPHKGSFRGRPHAEIALYELYRVKRLENHIDNHHDSVNEFDAIVEIIDHDIRTDISKMMMFLNYQINVIKCLMGYKDVGHFVHYMKKYSVCNGDDAIYLLTNKSKYPIIDILFNIVVFTEPTDTLYTMLKNSVSDKIIARHYTTIFKIIDSRMNKCKIAGKYFENYVFTNLTGQRKFIDFIEKYPSIILRVT